MASEERKRQIQEEWSKRDQEIMRVAGPDYEPNSPSYIAPHGDRLLTAEEFFEIYGETNAELIDGRVVFPGVEFGIRKMDLLSEVRKNTERLKATEQPRLKGIRYEGTILVLEATFDFKELVDQLKPMGLSGNSQQVQFPPPPNEPWSGIFHIVNSKGIVLNTEPQEDVEKILGVIESLSERQKAIWHKCSHREICLGYALTVESQRLSHGISVENLSRMAVLRATMRVSFFGHERDEHASCFGQ